MNTPTDAINPTFVDEIGHLVFRVGNTWLAAPVNAIAELTEPLPVTRIPRSPSHIPGVFALRGYAVPLLDLVAFLDLRAEATPNSPQDEFAHPRFVILEHEGSRVGLRSDQTRNVGFLTGAQHVDLGIVSNPRLRNVLHAALESGERMILLLDVERLLNEAKA